MMKTIFTLLSLVLYSAIIAQGKWDNAMRLKTCNIQIEANEFTATTFLEMEFCNDSKIDMEGLYRFQLKPYQVITAFQLELNGIYRDGSIEEKWKANNAYNRIVGKRVDPAILQMEYTGQYSLRIFPVPAGGCRKITFTIVERLRERGNALHYVLPISNIGEVENFNVKINTTKEPIPINSGILKDILFKNNQLEYHTKLMAKNDSLYFATSLQKEIIFTSKKDDITYFSIRYQPEKIKEKTINPKKITVFWDISASRQYENKDIAIEFLKKYIEKYKVDSFEIVTFNYKIKNIIQYELKDWNKTELFLKNLQYNGATQMGCINLDIPNSDAILLFTDGNSSYGKNVPKTGNVPIFPIVSTEFNRYYLLQLIGLTGGGIIQINKDNLGNCIAKANIAKELLLNITSDNKTLQLDQNVDTFLQTKTTLSGHFSGETESIILHYGNKKTNSFKIINLNNNTCSNNKIERLQMLDLFESIQHSQYNWDQQLLFGREEKIITQQTAYLVLERIEDYIKYQITPPKDIETQVKNNPDYVEIPKLNPIKINKEQTDLEQLRSIANFYNTRIAEWDNKLTKIDIANLKSKIINDRNTKDETKTKSEMMNPLFANSYTFRDKLANSEEVVVVGYASQRKQYLTGSVSYVNSKELNYASNLGQALQGRVSGLQVTQINGIAGNIPSIRIRGISSLNSNNSPLYVLDGVPIDEQFALSSLNVNDINDVTILKDISASAIYGSRAAYGAIIINTKKGKYYYRNTFASYKLKNAEDVEYITEFKGTEKNLRYSKYKELQNAYRFDKTFYFDIAELFYEAGDIEIVKEIITNAAELANNDPAILQAIAFCFDKWKMYSDAQEIYKSLVEQYPNNLQYHRNLALSFQLEGKFQEALDCYNSALLNTLNAPLQKAFILNEMNALIGSNREKLNLENINNELIKILPLDLRVVVENNNYSNQTVKIITKNELLNKTAHSYNGYNFNQNGYLPIQEFLYKNATENKLIVELSYYGNYYTPDMYRIITYKNFGKPDQSIEIENYILDNQYGNVIIHEKKW